MVASGCVVEFREKLFQSLGAVWHINLLENLMRVVTGRRERDRRVMKVIG